MFSFKQFHDEITRLVNAINRGGGGGGGGSSVAWTQLFTEGEKIATIDIDGEETDVYAPTGDGPIKFGIDDDGNYGYYKDGADTVTPFSYPIDFFSNLNYVTQDACDKSANITDCEIGKLYIIISFVQNWRYTYPSYPTNFRLEGCEILNTLYNEPTVDRTNADTWLGVKCDVVKATSTTITSTAYTDNWGSIYLVAIKLN